MQFEIFFGSQIGFIDQIGYLLIEGSMFVHQGVYIGIGIILGVGLLLCAWGHYYLLMGVLHSWILAGARGIPVQAPE